MWAHRRGSDARSDGAASFVGSMLGHGVAADARVPSPFAEELEEEAEEAAKSAMDGHPPGSWGKRIR